MKTLLKHINSSVIAIEDKIMCLAMKKKKEYPFPESIEPSVLKALTLKAGKDYVEMFINGKMYYTSSIAYNNPVYNSPDKWENPNNTRDFRHEVKQNIISTFKSEIATLQERMWACPDSERKDMYDKMRLVINNISIKAQDMIDKLWDNPPDENSYTC